jgi:Ca2+-binding EF-hand superfamily protein
MRKEELSITQKKEVKDAYKIITNKYPDGLLRVNDLKIAMMGLGLNPSNDEIDRIITQLKLSKKLKKDDVLETMTFDEFYDTVHFRIINKKLNFEKESERMFDLITEQKSDFITEKNIRSLAEHFEVKEKNEDIQKIVKVSDVDKDGKISYKDFVEILKHSNYT